MNKSITQDNQNDKQISTSIRKFFTRFHVSSVIIPGFQRILVAVQRTLTVLQPISPNPRINSWRPQFSATDYKCSVIQSCLPWC